MGVKVYYSEISAHKEVKKRQQKVMMILESKSIPYVAIDITEAGKESDKDFMLSNGKPKGDSKYALSPQVFNEDVYCGDYEDFELANENDELEKFLNVEKVERRQSMLNGNQNQNQNANSTVNGTSASRENSAEKEAKEKSIVEETPAVPEPPAEEPIAVKESHPDVEEEEPMSTSEPVPQPPPEEEALDDVQPDPKVLEEDAEEG